MNAKKIAYILIFSFAYISILYLSFQRFNNLNANVADLGFFLNNFKNIYKTPSLAFENHFQLLYFVWGLIFLIIKNNLIASIIILFLQVSVVFYIIYQVGLKLGKFYSILLIFYLPIWSLLLFDFHFDHLMVPISFFYLIFLNEKKYYKSLSIISLSIFVKETYIFYLFLASIIYLILYFQEKDKKTKKILYNCFFLSILFGILFTLLSIFLITLYSSDNHLTQTVNLFSIFSIGDLIILKKKFIFFLIIFGSFAFLPLINFRFVILASPLILVAFFSTEENYFNYNTHYAAATIIPAIFGLKDILKKYRYRWLRIVVLSVTILINIYFSNSIISRFFWTDKIDSLTLNSYLLTERKIKIKYYIKKELSALIKENIVISSQNNVFTESMIGSKKILPFPMGYIKNNYKDIQTGQIFIYENKHELLPDIIIVDKKIDMFLFDRSCGYYFKVCTNIKHKKNYENIYDYLKNDKRYSLISRYDKFEIYKKK